MKGTGKDPTERAASNALESGLTRGQTECRQSQGRNPRKQAERRAHHRVRCTEVTWSAKQRPRGNAHGRAPRQTSGSRRDFADIMKTTALMGRRSRIPWGGRCHPPERERRAGQRTRRGETEAEARVCWGPKASAVGFQGDCGEDLGPGQDRASRTLPSQVRPPHLGTAEAGTAMGVWP